MDKGKTARRIWNKGQAYTALINCTRWRAVRKDYLTQHPLCEDCLQAGRTTAATLVHHIKPLEDYIGNAIVMEVLAYDESNLRALCHDCHIAVHIALKSKSKDANRKRKEGLTEAFMKRFSLDE